VPSTHSLKTSHDVATKKHLSGIICIKKDYMTSTRPKNPKELKINFQDRTSTCPCAHSKWPHYSTPATFLKNNTLPRKRMKYIHVTIYNVPLQTNLKRHVKIIFFNFAYLSFGFHVAMMNRKRETEGLYSLISALQSSEITHSVTKLVSEICISSIL
jgi:hypothetical protein